jgi:hypothetical protein
VAHEAELGFLAPSLAIKLRLAIRGRGMRGVAALLAVKIALAIAARAGQIVRTAGKTLVPCRLRILAPNAARRGSPP